MFLLFKKEREYKGREDKRVNLFIHRYFFTEKNVVACVQLYKRILVVWSVCGRCGHIVGGGLIRKCALKCVADERWDGHMPSQLPIYDAATGPPISNLTLIDPLLSLKLLFFSYPFSLSLSLLPPIFVSSLKSLPLFGIFRWCNIELRRLFNVRVNELF